jgi:hypothetical protein
MRASRVRLYFGLGVFAAAILLPLAKSASEVPLGRADLVPGVVIFADPGAVYISGLDGNGTAAQLFPQAPPGFGPGQMPGVAAPPGVVVVVPTSSPVPLVTPEAQPRTENEALPSVEIERQPEPEPQSQPSS